MQTVPDLGEADEEAALRAEQLDLLCRGAYRTIAPAVGSAVFIAWVAKDSAPAWLTWPWVILYIALSVARTLFARRTLLNPGRDVRAALRVFTALAFATGACMGLVSLLLFPYLDTIDRALLTVVQVAIAPGGVASTAGYRPAVLVDSPVSLLSSAVAWLLWGHGKSTAIVPVLIFLLAVLMSFARQYEQQVRERIAKETERNRALAALQLEKKHLQQARDAADTALAVARQANVAKSQFLAAASHDLRQPLHAMMLFIGSLESYVHGDEAKALHGRLSFTAGILEDQFNSLLDLSKYDADAIKPEPTVFRLNTLLTELIQEMQPQAQAKGLALSVSSPAAMVRTDMLLIDRLLRNLLSNAIRFTDRGSVTVICEATPSGLSVAVVDTGPGIAAVDQEKVFGEFVQLNNPARRRDKGVGLGLAIARRISNLLGLRLTLTSAVGLGSRFEFVVPTIEVGAQTANTTDDPVPPGDENVTLVGRRVVVVEDDPLVCEAMAQQFRSWGVQAMFVESLEEVRAIARAGAAIDVALIDDMLGQAETGLDIARWLWAEMPGVQISLLTGNTRPERLAELRQSGIPILLKPLPPHRLRAALNRQSPDDRQ